MSQSSNKVLVVACMKDEGPFLLEWIAYYQSIGVDKFLIVTNDCNDGTDHMLDRLEVMGIVRHLPNPVMIETFSNSIQNVALKYAALQREFRETDWVFIVDADEFLNIRIGNNDLPSLFAELPPFDAISFNQVIFGSAQTEVFEYRQVTRQFTYRFRIESDPRLYPMMFGIKTLARQEETFFSRFSNHVPRLKKKAADEVTWLDGAGREMHPGFKEDQPRSYPVYMRREEQTDGQKVKRRKVFDVKTPSHAVGYVNHYSLRSLESFIMQSLRGDAVSAEVRRDVGYWQTYDRNHVHDTTIHTQAARSDAWLEALLKDPVLNRLHRGAVKYHRKTYQQMIKTEAIQTLITDCKKAMTVPGVID